MKKLFSLLAIIGIILASNCSRIPENNDPVIGIWTNLEVTTSQSAKNTIKKEWIFNDAYLGRYHTYNNNKIEVITDFSWKKEDEMYIISYPGLENKTNDMVKLKEVDGSSFLQDTSGKTLAIRE